MPGAQFPTALPSFTDLDPNLTLAQNSHSARHNKVHAELAALLSKVGIDGSANTNTLDYKVAANASSLATQGGQISGLTTSVNALTTALGAYATKAGAETLTNKTISTGSVIDANVNVVEVLKKVYPVGSLYISTSSTNPATLFGFGTWAAYAQGKALVGIDLTDSDFNSGGLTGGSKYHWHWQTIGNDGGGVYMGVAGQGVFNTGASPQSRVVTVDRTTIATGSRSTNGARFDGTDTASTLQPYIVTYIWTRTA